MSYKVRSVTTGSYCRHTAIHHGIDGMIDFGNRFQTSVHFYNVVTVANIEYKNLLVH